MTIIKIFLLTFIFGWLSNELGGILGYLGTPNKKSINNTMSFTAGITTAIICFELLKQAFEISSKYNVVFFTVIGVLIIKILDIAITILHNNKSNNESLVIVSAMSAHNITEGIAIGAAFRISYMLGISLLVSILLHNIPEGIIIGSVLKKENKTISYVSKYCIIIGIFLGIGAIIGTILGELSSGYIMPSLAISAGAMLYIVACELIPGISQEKNSKTIGIIYIIGFIIGCLMCKL